MIRAPLFYYVLCVYEWAQWDVSAPPRVLHTRILVRTVEVMCNNG